MIPLPGSRTAYRRGAALERRIMEELGDTGYIVTRSAGSHSPADLWAARKRRDGEGGILLMVQVKRSAADFGSSEWNELYDAAEQAGCAAVLAFAPPRGRVQYYWLRGPRLKHSRVRHWQLFEP